MEKEFICWYAYSGMETEGHLDLYEPKIFNAIDIADAMWQYHDWLYKTKKHNREPMTTFYEDLEDFRSKGDITGWGYNCRELKSKFSQYDNERR